MPYVMLKILPLVGVLVLLHEAVYVLQVFLSHSIPLLCLIAVDL